MTRRRQACRRGVVFGRHGGLACSASAPLATLLPRMSPPASPAALQGLPAGGRVQFEVELLGFDKQASEHALPGPAKLERAGKLKEQGNALFKQVGWGWEGWGLGRPAGPACCSAPQPPSSAHAPHRPVLLGAG